MQELILIGCGALIITTAIMDWDWFFSSRTTRLTIMIFGRKIARIIYSIIGFGMIIVAIAVLLGG
ncbi:MAG: immunity 17 family protein [Anaerolineae bacterium]|nr:immunity 17 family protein [Anaerolineae bacterium]